MIFEIGGTGFPARGDRLESLSHQIHFQDFMASERIFRGSLYLFCCFLMIFEIGGTGFPARGDRLESLSRQIHFQDFMASERIFRGSLYLCLHSPKG